MTYERMKRVFDFTVASVILFALSPFMLLVALAVFLQDGRWPFFSQVRLGKHGKPFLFWKFRTMVPNAAKMKTDLQKESGHGIRFKMKDDPRVTRLGKYLRKYSIDELPQLWNVVRGDMSLVGPRPPTPDEAMKYSQHEFNRLLVPGGITGFWQIFGRSELTFEDQVKLDIKYVKERSMLTDLEILVKTVPAVVSGRGAY